MKSRKLSKHEKISYSYTLCTPSQAPRYFSLEWTCAQPVEISSDKPVDYLLGCGPYLFLYNDKMPHDEAFSFSRQSSIFEATGTFIRGVVDSYKGYFLAWGGSYIARVAGEQLENGRTVCPQDILSTGREIISIRTFQQIMAHGVEIYYADGTIEMVQFLRGGRSFAVKLCEIFRLPLKSTEKVTAICERVHETLLATSHGRILGTLCNIQLYDVDSEINSPIRQLLAVKAYSKADPAVMLLYENGSIAYWYNYRKGRTNFIEVKGRFTCIYQSKFNGFGLSAGNRSYILAGDMDGNLTVFLVHDKILKVTKTMKCIASNKITLITDANDNNLFIGTAMGDYQVLDMMQLCEIKYDVKLPLCLADSRCYYKTAAGWYFLKDDQLCLTTRAGKTTVIKSSFGKKNLKMKYLSCTAVPDREIAMTYNQFGYGIQIKDYGKGTKDFLWEMNLKAEKKQIRIIKVVLMQSYVLLQYKHGAAELLYIDSPKSKCVPLITCDNIGGTITTAACLEDYKEEGDSTKIIHLLIGYRNGKIGWSIIQWNTVSMATKVLSSNAIDASSSSVVSIITSQEHLGNCRCITLNHSGTASISCAQLETTSIYLTGPQLHLSPIIGRGHSLFETSLGILAAGFKQHTLNVCWISMGLSIPPQYGYLFSVDTRSCRLPYTLIEEKRQQPRRSRHSTQKVIVSYYDNDGIKEKSFPITVPQSMNGVKNSGIITNCYVRHDMKDEMQFVVYSGDVDGTFCVWNLADEDYHIRKQNHFANYQLNGAVTSIHGMETSHLIAVATSQGDLDLFRIITEYTYIFPVNQLKMEQKISFLTSYISRPDNQRRILIFLEGGMVEEVKVKDALTVNSATMDEKTRKVAQFPVATKKAFTTAHPNKSHDHYVLALGIDGILRRTKLHPPGNTGYFRNMVVRLRWKISAITQLTIHQKSMLLVGDPRGWVYIMISTGGRTVYFEVDRYHKHEVIDIICHATKNYGTFICSLDITGTVVIRRLRATKKVYFSFSEFPLIWTSPVPFPRKLVGIPERQIMVVGKGVATKSF